MDWVALLRGVNVSGHNRLPMADLRRELEKAGLGAVRTYLQSGNAVFAAGGDAALHAEAVRKAAADASGAQADAVVLSAGEMRAVAEGNPFLPGGSGSPESENVLYVTFLLHAGDPELPSRFAGLTLPAAAGEEAILAGRVVYLSLPHGYGRTKLNNAYFEKALGVPATTRNWRTVLALAALACEHQRPPHRMAAKTKGVVTG
jgi:uncharacterized protein (DUF1697 family)